MAEMKVGKGDTGMVIAGKAKGKGGQGLRAKPDSGLS